MSSTEPTTTATTIATHKSQSSTYSPISTLERQAQTNRFVVFVQTNANCCLPGGVEYVLQQQTKQAKGMTLPDTAQGMDGSTTPTNEENPFGFLESTEHDSDYDDAGSTGSRGKKKGPNLGRFLKKVAKSTTAQLERGMHHLAVRADQGRNPDQLSAGIYHATTDQLLCMTEAAPMMGDAIRFVVPLTADTAAAAAANTVFTIKLWIRSGAALLHQTKAAKNYFIGALQVNLQQQQQQQQPLFLNDLELQSNLVIDGRLNLLVLPDTKFPALCGRAWSLTDPDRAAYPKHLFNIPLEQSYGFDFPARPHATVVASERATESSVVLPVATAVAELTSRAAHISGQHATSVAARIAAYRHDVPAGANYAQTTIEILPGGMQWSTNAASVGVSFTTIPHATVQLAWQRPDSIFEVDLAPPLKVPVSMQRPVVDASSGQPVQVVQFYPKPCQTDILPAVWQAHGARFPPSGFLLGTVRVIVTVPKAPEPQNPFAPTQAGTQTAPMEIWDCLISLDTLLAQQQQQPSGVPQLFPILNPAGQHVANIPLKIALGMQQGTPVPAQVVPSTGGLVSLMGLPRLVQDQQPALDYEALALNSAGDERARQRQQLATMGPFVTQAYMEQHNKVYRDPEIELWSSRAKAYRTALQQPQAEDIPPHEDRSPRPFRPSSSRLESTVAGIGFNVHTSTLGINVWDPQQPVGQQAEPQMGAEFQNITCGAPCDHIRGFSNVFPKSKEDANNPNASASSTGQLGASPVGPVTGGLRRLESKRQELAYAVSNLQMTLTMSIANYFVEQRQFTRKALSHVPPRHPELASLRWQLFEAVQSLHHVTWHCATRRAACFSQALGIALSSYLTSLSDPSKWQSTWPDLWARHGYLVSFEGLLSAAGKELGMIEDASVGISMLSMVKVVLVPDGGTTAPPADTVPVPSSPYLKWIRLTPSGSHPEVEYTLQVGMVQSYYDQRIPASLKNNTPVRLYPLLFEVGVDIRQWGAHAGSNMYKNYKDRNAPAENEQPKEPAGGLLDDEDDDVGVTDDDVLVQLNSEAFQKLNAYAYSISPANSDASLGAQRTHPMLETLHQHIASSAGRINHDIVDEAATIAQQLGGGGVVFCKSGKDRTAMHVTYKQSQFANRFRQRHPAEGSGETEQTDILARVLEDATTMRIRGTRLPICEKNVGQAKYAFNSLQVKFMPEKLKPPMSTLAGFLKGGKVFSGGGIES